MTALRSFLFSVAFILVSAIVPVVATPLLVSRRLCKAGIPFYERIVLALARVLLGVSWRLRGTANRPDGPAIYAVTHQSTFEALALHLILNDPAVVLKQELAKLPFWGWYTRRAGLIAVDRSAGTQALRHMVAEAKAARDAGRDIAIFPQGTRTPPGVRTRYHAGVAALYTNLKLPVVPVAVNSGLVWPKGLFAKKPGQVTMEMLPPIPPGLNRKTFMARLESELEAATDRLVREAGGSFADRDTPATEDGKSAAPSES